MIAMAQHEAPQVDLDALQAQISLSMSLTEDLVSSWIRPIAKNLAKPGQSSKTTEKELQEYLRRPPRLGVGAPLPESSGGAERETIKLKHKLSVNEKKRRREDAEGKVDKIAEEDEHFERKGESSAKKMRLDPFSLSQKKKKKTDSVSLSESKVKELKVKELEGAGADEHMTKELPANGLSTNNSPLKPTSFGTTETASTGQTGGLLPEGTMSLSKKRRKKKKFAVVAQVEDAGGTNSASAIDTSALSHESSPELETEEPEEKANNSEWTGFGDAAELKEGMKDELRDKTPISAMKTPTVSPTSKPTSGLLLSPLRVLPGPPLLNLHGPPLSDTEDAANLSQAGLSPTAKKKRKRNRRKKKHLANDRPSTS